MTLVRDIAAETIKALAALALIFLCFAHTPLAPANGSGDLSTDISWCGKALEESDEAPASCHGCRPDGAVLPTPPCMPAPAFGAVVDAPLVAAIQGFSHNAVFGPANPRAPPASV